MALSLVIGVIYISQSLFLMTMMGLVGWGSGSRSGPADEIPTNVKQLEGDRAASTRKKYINMLMLDLYVDELPRA